MMMSKFPVKQRKVQAKQNAHPRLCSFITLIDPTIEEQHLSTGCLIVAANNQQELVAVVKYGGRASVSAERVLALSRRAVIMFDQQCDHAKHWVVEDLKTRETGKVDLMRGKGKK